MTHFVLHNFMNPIYNLKNKIALLVLRFIFCLAQDSRQAVHWGAWVEVCEYERERQRETRERETEREKECVRLCFCLSSWCHIRHPIEQTAEQFFFSFFSLSPL